MKNHNQETKCRKHVRFAFFFCVFVKFLVILFFTSDQRDKYGLPQSRVL